MQLMVPDADPAPKALSRKWGLLTSGAAMALNLYLWVSIPSGAWIFGANTLLYAGVMAHWQKKKKRHLQAKLVGDSARP